jgi:hypothetical protein
MDVDTSSPLSRAELLELCRRTGLKCPTPGDAMLFGSLSMRLLASMEGDQALANVAVSVIKQTAPDVLDSLLEKLLDANGTTQGLRPRLTELVRVAERHAAGRNGK